VNLPFILRHHHATETAKLRAQIRDAETERVRLTRRLTDKDIANQRLSDHNTELQRRLDAYGTKARTVPDVLEEHDVHRKALADALGEQKRHLNWDQLIAEVAGVVKACVAWKAEVAGERARADRLALDLTEASAEEIAAWEARVKAHWAWKPPTDQEARPVDGASGRPTHPATDLRRALERCRALQALRDQRGKRVAP
jgi:chromosome segregation ATPase